MVQDTKITRVIFRKFKQKAKNDAFAFDNVIAIFPDLAESDFTYLSYMHVGQHGACLWPHSSLVRCTAQEYDALYGELTNQIGYRLKVLKRWPRRIAS